MPRSPKPKQVEEWLEGEVTRYFRALIQAQLDHYFACRSEVYHPYEPQKTQEDKARFLGCEAALQDILDAMDEKDLKQLEIVDEERVRNSPSSGSGIDPAG
jgi:hypothetical protein